MGKRGPRDARTLRRAAAIICTSLHRLNHAPYPSSQRRQAPSPRANIVGYQTNNVRDNESGAQVFTMMSIPFAGVTGGDFDTTNLKITGALKTDDPGTYGDIIQIWKKDEGGVDEYYCYTEDGLWYNTLTEELLTDDYSDGIPAGSAFWYLLDMFSDESASRAASTTITFNNPLK